MGQNHNSTVVQNRDTRSRVAKGAAFILPEIPPEKQSMPTAAENRSVRFTIVHILYVVALIASALATFGVWGIIPAFVALVVWAIVFDSSSRPQALATVCLWGFGGLCCLGLLGLLVPAIPNSRTAAPRSECANNLKQIALALHNYHDVHGTFPPAYTRDKNGKRMHSWRVLILPFIEEQPLYDAYKFDEPWDGPNNRKLASQVPYPYTCPSHSSSNRRGTSCTNYFAVVSSKTAWPQTTAGHLKHIHEADGTSQTLLVVEAHLPDVTWTEPRDLSFDEAMHLLTSSDPSRTPAHRYEDFFYDYYAGSNAAMVDSNVRLLHRGLPRDTAAALLTYNGAEQIRESLDTYPDSTAKRLKFGNCYRLAMFVVWILFPLPWVWISPRRTAEREAQSAEFVN